MWRSMIFFKAFIAASTGPFPLAAASNFSPEIFSPRLATERTPTPLVTCRYSSFTRWFCVRSAPASTRISSSLISFFLSANFRKASYTLSSCSCSSSTPNTCKRFFKAARPLRAVNTIELSSMPTSCGSIIS